MDHSQRRLNPEFVFNQPRYSGARILLTRENFGCGSSREHAPWAILDYGISCIIAPSYADIFYNNCFKNGILPMTLSHAEVDELFGIVESNQGCEFEIDLDAQTLDTGHGRQYRFEIETALKERLLNGLDDIGLTLQHADKIRAYEQRQQARTPWVFN